MSRVVLGWEAVEIGLEPRESRVGGHTCGATAPALCPAPGPCRPHLRSVLSPRAPEAAGTMLRVLVGAVLPVMVLAAPPPINKLALFPDKSAWCEAKNITQIVGHSGCEAKSIQNRWDPGGRQLGGVRTGAQRGGRGQAARSGTDSGLSSRRACLGQCFSYSVPNTFPQSTESLVHCDSCMPAQSMWEIVSTARRGLGSPGPGPRGGRVRGWRWGYISHLLKSFRGRPAVTE